MPKRTSGSRFGRRYKSHPRRPTYPQHWTSYNASQTTEKAVFRSILFDLTEGLDQLVSLGPGRPPIPLRDAVFCAAYKVYTTFSARRFMTDLREAQVLGFIEKVPHFNTVLNSIGNKELTEVLKGLICRACVPLREFEECFAIDSSGFSSSRFHRWLDHRSGVHRSKHEWVKIHLMCGVRTKIITAVDVRGQHAADVEFLPSLLAQTTANFHVKELLGDKGYYANNNFDAADAHGADPYIMFKRNVTGVGSPAVERMYHLFKYKEEEFLKHYHQRSNVESAFSMMKRKFGDNVRGRTETAKTNEALLKILCHNVCVLSNASMKFGIDPMAKH